MSKTLAVALPLTLKIGKKSVVVSDLAEASRKYQEARDYNMVIDGGDANTFPFGRVVRGGRAVARISYNGRVWDGETLLMEAANGAMSAKDILAGVL